MHSIILAQVIIFTKGYELTDLETCVKNGQNPSPTIIPPDISEKDGGDEPGRQITTPDHFFRCVPPGNSF